jgi:hypothetical protein
MIGRMAEGDRDALPVICELTSESVTTRRARLLPTLAARAERRDDLPNGYRLTFSPSGEMLHTIAAVIDAERQCCRWLQFELTVTPGGGPVVLTLNGPEGARDFLSALFEN